LRKNAGISISSMPLLDSASTLAAAWLRALRHTLGGVQAFVAGLHGAAATLTVATGLRHLVEDGQVVGAGAQRLLRRLLHRVVHGVVRGLLHHQHGRGDGGLARRVQARGDDGHPQRQRSFASGNHGTGQGAG
jgi:hypothetical protein